MTSDYRRMALDTLAAIAGYEVSIEAPPAPSGGGLWLYAQTEEPEQPAGVWISDSGANGTAYLCDTFDVDADGAHWQAADAMPAILHDHGAAVLGDDLYLVGGVKGSTSTAASSAGTGCLRYSFAAGAWRACTDLPAKKFHPSAVAADGMLYVLHCESCGESGDPHLNWYRYSPAADSWQQAFTWPYPSACVNTDGAAVLGGCIYVCGGNDTPNATQGHGGTGACYRYDLATGTLTQIATMSNPHACGSAAAVNGSIVMSGGNFYLSRTNSGVTQITEVYTPDLGAWRTVTAQPVKRAIGRCAAAGSAVWYTGGGAAPYVYHPATDTWQMGERVRPNSTSDISEQGHSLVAHGSDLWFSGGRTGMTSATPDTAQYRLRTAALSDYLEGDAIVVCRPAAVSVPVGDRCEIPIGAAWIVENGALRTAECSVGDGSGWTAL